MNLHSFDASKPELFIYKEYHVEAFHDSEIKPTYRNIMRKVRNNLTVALNKFPTVLPNYVIIMTSNSYMHDPAFVEFEMGTILKKVLNDVTRLLASRKEQLTKKNKNLTTPTEVYVTRPLPKPARAITRDYQFKNTRRNFNQLLDKLSKTLNFRPLNVDGINCSDRLLFDKSGELSDFGQERMWVSISEFIRVRDTRRQLAVRNFSVAKEDVATQTDRTVMDSSSCESNPSVTGAGSYNYGDPYIRDEVEGDRRWDQPEGSQGRHHRRQFDSYHRQYDRDDYQGYYH